MNARKNKLWKPLDEAAKHAKVSRATVYRWIDSGRLDAKMSVKKQDGVTVVDVYALAEKSWEPRRSRGRMLAIQKVRAENRRIRSRTGAKQNNALSLLLRATGKTSAMIAHGEMSWMTRQVLLGKISVLKELVEKATLQPSR